MHVSAGVSKEVRQNEILVVHFVGEKGLISIGDCYYEWKTKSQKGWCTVYFELA
jgi:hypothetical protein